MTELMSRLREALGGKYQLGQCPSWIPNEFYLSGSVRESAIKIVKSTSATSCNSDFISKVILEGWRVDDILADFIILHIEEGKVIAEEELYAIVKNPTMHNLLRKKCSDSKVPPLIDDLYIKALLTKDDPPIQALKAIRDWDGQELFADAVISIFRTVKEHRISGANLGNMFDWFCLITILRKENKSIPVKEIINCIERSSALQQSKKLSNDQAKILAKRICQSHNGTQLLSLNIELSRWLWVGDSDFVVGLLNEF